MHLNIITDRVTGWDSNQFERIITLSDQYFAETIALTTCTEFQDFVSRAMHSML
jgi:uncharacterized Fe-S cluster-containing radical SAM superfamily protein